MSLLPPLFSPLDEERELLAGPFTPSLVESIVRLGTWMPFVPVTEGIAYFCKVDLSEATARRKTEAAGQADVEVQTAQVTARERAERPEAPVGRPVQQLSVDGAMVPLLHQQWGEVKTVALGVGGAPILNQRTGEWEVHTTQLSYVSRMADHQTFSRLATVETHRRGTATAGTVGAVNDGADWEQEFVDDHRPDAVRILDWGHGAEHGGKVAGAVFGAETPEAEAWRTAQLKELKAGDPARLLRDLRQLRGELAGGTPEAKEQEVGARVVGPGDRGRASALSVEAAPRRRPSVAPPTPPQRPTTKRQLGRLCKTLTPTQKPSCNRIGLTRKIAAAVRTGTRPSPRGSAPRGMIGQEETM